MAQNREINIILRAVDRTKGAFRAVQRGLKGMAESVAAIGSRLGLAFGVFAGGGIVANVKRTADQMDRLAKTASKLGTSTAELSKLAFAADLTGVSTETLTVSLQRMVRRVGEAAQGAGVAKDALAELGLNAVELAALKPEEQFKAIADAMGDIPNRTDKVRLAFKLFDSQGVALLNTLEGGSAALDEMGEKLEALGGVIDDKAAKAAEEFNDNLLELETHLKAISLDINTNLIPVMNDLFGLMRGQSLERIELGPSGLGEQIDDVIDKIFRLKQQRDALQSGGGIFFGNQQIREIQSLEEVNKQIAELEKERAKLLEGKAQKRSLLKREATEREHNRNMAAVRKEQTANLKDALKDRENAYRAHVDALSNFRDQQAAIAAEVGSLLEEVLGAGETEQGNIERFDVLGKLNEAQSALGAGELQNAIALVRQGLQLLRDYKDQSGEGRQELLLLAEGFRAVFEAAQGAQGAELEGNVERGRKAFEDMQKQLEGKPATITVEAEEAAGSKVHRQVQEGITELGPVTVPVIIDIQGTVAPTGGVAQVSDSAAVLEREALKRGFRL